MSPGCYSLSERIASWRKDTRCQSSDTATSACEISGHPIRSLSAWMLTGKPLLSNLPPTRPTVVKGEHLAYVVYTSGSTDSPKG